MQHCLFQNVSKCIKLKRDLSAAHCEQINVYKPCSYTFEILHSMHHLLIIVFLSHTIISSFFFSAEAHHSFIVCSLSLYPHSSIFPFILAAPWVGFRLYLKGPFDLRGQIFTIYSMWPCTDFVSDCVKTSTLKPSLSICWMRINPPMIGIS